MAKKRKQRRNPIQQLDFQQEMELMIGDGGKSCFESELQQKAAWYHHRDAMLELCRDEYPGRRPWAYWKFEQPEAGRFTPQRQEWAYLLENNLLLDGELPLVLALWAKMLEMRKGFIKMTYEMNGKPTWRELSGMYECQAGLLGPVARDAWSRAKAEVVKSVQAKKIPENT